MEPQQLLANITSAVVNIAMGVQSYLYLDNLSDGYGFKDTQAVITVRDITRIAFAELGIEIEFSGKNDREKGVIIDIDDDKIMALGLSTNALKFGQTVVKINALPGNETVTEKENNHTSATVITTTWQSQSHLNELINELLKSSAEKIRLNSW
jgi:GDPmannose 4,6-dehydratase